MAFIAIDAKADVADRKKGKLTPAQHAQLNAWCLASKTGIFDWGGRCESTLSSYTVSGGSATVIFNKGYLVICGRFVECEDNTQIDITAPISGTVSGKIIVRFNLNNSGNDEFVLTFKTGALRQDDLNINPLGTYEFELYSYEITPSTITLTRTNTDYIPDIGGKLAQFITVLTGTGMTGTGNPPLQGYDQSKGTIEERLDALGFSQGDVTLHWVSTNQGVTDITVQNAIKKQGKIVWANFTVNLTGTGVHGVSFNRGDTIMTIPSGFEPKEMSYASLVMASQVNAPNGVIGRILEGETRIIANGSTSAGFGSDIYRIILSWETN